MITADQLILNWQGHSTIETVLSQMETVSRVQIRLADNYNHVLFERFKPEADRINAETLDMDTDVGALNTLSGIPGLEAFAELVEPLAALQTSVYISSPPPLVTLVFPDYPSAA